MVVITALAARHRLPAIYGDRMRPVVGYAVSFPKSPTAEGVEYRVGELFWRRQLGSDDEPEDGDV